MLWLGLGRLWLECLCLIYRGYQGGLEALRQLLMLPCLAQAEFTGFEDGDQPACIRGSLDRKLLSSYI